MYYLKRLSHQLRLALNYYGWIGLDAYEYHVWKRKIKLRLIFFYSKFGWRVWRCLMKKTKSTISKHCPFNLSPPFCKIHLSLCLLSLP